MLTIRECLSFGGLADAKVVAGNNYIDREVRSISILEIADSSVAQWASSYELYISSFYSVKDDVSLQQHIVRALASCGCSGLIIGHVGLHIKDIKPELIELCEKLQFPLIVANPNNNYLSIMNPIFKRLMHLPQNNGFVSISTDVINSAVHEKNIYNSLKQIAVLSNLVVSFFDYNYHCLFSNKSENDTDTDQRILVNSDYSKADHSSFEFDYKDRKILVVRNPNIQRWGYIVINNRSKSNLIQMKDSIMIAFDIILSRLNVLTDSKKEYIKEFWGHMENGDFNSEMAAIEMGDRVGVRLQQIHHIIVIDIKDKPTETILYETIFKWLTNRINSMLKALNSDNISFIHDGRIINLLTDCNGDSDYTLLGQRLEKLFSDQEDMLVSIGISEYFKTVSEIPNAYSQAISAADLGFTIKGKNRAVHYSEIWGYEYMRKLSEDQNILNICLKKMNKLISNDSSGVFMETLKVLLQCNADISIASVVLNVHRNTIVYRKNKITELLQEDPFMYPQNFIYQMAMNILSSKKPQ